MRESRTLSTDRFPLAFSTLGCPDWTFEQAAAHAAQHGYAGLEVRIYNGDIIPATIEALKADGTELRTPVDWRKASVWVLKRNKRGRIVTATVWPPPKV